MRRIRPQLSYANVMSTLAVFLLLGGGAFAAVKLKKNSVKSKHIAPEAVTGDDANEATFGKVPSAGTADTANTAGTANGVIANAIGAGNIQDRARSLNIPLSSFRDATNGGTVLDADPGDEGDLTAPDFEVDNGSLMLTFDYDFDGPVTFNYEPDTDAIVSTLALPQDYASTPFLSIWATKSGNSGVTERLRCNTTIGGGAPTALVDNNIVSSAIVNYVFALEGTYFKSAAVSIRCRVDDGSGGGLWDDDVQLRSAELRYTAEQ